MNKITVSLLISIILLALVGCQNPAGSSAPTTITAAPAVANAGSAQSGITPTSTVTLSGSASTNATTYSWTLAGPTGSTATLTGASTASPTFQPDVCGTYTATLTVNDGSTSTVTIATQSLATVLTKTWAINPTGQTYIVKQLVFDGAGTLSAYRSNLVTPAGTTTYTISGNTITLGNAASVSYSFSTNVLTYNGTVTYQ